MASPGGLDRLVRKEVSLGAIREKLPPANHLGLQIAPFLDVATDDVIFDYIKNNVQEGLAPARAEDAEAELAQKDEMTWGQGRAALIDWALKDKYTASDVTRYREDLLLQQAAQGISSQLSLNFTGRTVADFQARLAREEALRKRKLDNRIESLIMGGLADGTYVYNDGKIKFTVDYGRPGGQQNTAPAGGLWSLTTCDPIGDLLTIKQTVRDTYGVELTKGITSQRAVNNLWKSTKFLAAVGVPVVGGTPSAPLDPNYLGLSGYTPEGALRIVEAATGINFTIYDAYYRTRPIGGTTFTNTRFVADDKVILLPGEGDLGEIDDTQLGFAKTLTSPHPEGNWASGFYEWEMETRDPWMHVRGTGVKAFPVFPYMEYTWTMDVL
jgi:hypothetical protein